MSTSRRQFTACLWASFAFARGKERIVLSCLPNNDLYRALPSIERFDKPEKAIHHARVGTGVAILDSLPLSDELLSQARKKRLRLYLEYAPPQNARIANRERAVVTSSFFGESLPPKSILSLHACRYVALSGGKTHLTLAKVAGFDKAVFGLPPQNNPVLIERESDQLLLASAPLSKFVTARYGPYPAWLIVWKQIFRWLLNNQDLAIQPAPTVRPSFPAFVALPADAEKNAVSKGVEWYSAARLFVHPSWAYKLEEAIAFEDRVGPPPTEDMPVGDGTLGMIEGHSSKILPEGKQPARWWIRADCVGETAMVHALVNRPNIAKNLVDFLMKSKMFTAARLDPSNVAYGLLGWNETTRYYKEEDGFDVYYGDDNARCLLGLIATSALTGETRWLQRIWLAILADFRLVGKNGHQKSRYDQKPLAEAGWQCYHTSDMVLHDMNYQAYPWAVFLWAFSVTGYQPFLDRCRTGIRLSVEAYPNWRWSNSITSQLARLILPLAWLVRVNDTAEVRSWLQKISGELLSYQHSSGAIAEQTGPPGTGIQTPPKSNEEYGGGEGALIQENGDPAADLLYTMNFAFIGLHEAYHSTGDAAYKEATDRIADFVIRVQAQSTVHPEFDGAWYRAFDFKNWEYWASNSDSGWGAWCTEAGWSQSWITSTLSLRLIKTSLWDVLRTTPPFPQFPDFRRRMFPD